MNMTTSKNSKYGLIGSGRLAHHLSSYFTLLDIPFEHWARTSSANFLYKSGENELVDILEESTHILLAISDSAINEFYSVYSNLVKNKIWIHFSGALHFAEINGAHPLMSFGPELYDLKTYQQIPFICETGQANFSDLFPQLTNPSYRIAPEKKALYHSYCVASGNFTSLLWREVIQSFSDDLGLPLESIKPYMEVIFSNLLKDNQRAATGPLVRGDKETIDLNLHALRDKPLHQVYQAFVAMNGSKHGHH